MSQQRQSLPTAFLGIPRGNSDGSAAAATVRGSAGATAPPPLPAAAGKPRPRVGVRGAAGPRDPGPSPARRCRRAGPRAPPSLRPSLPAEDGGRAARRRRLPQRPDGRAAPRSRRAATGLSAARGAGGRPSALPPGPVPCPPGGASLPQVRWRRRRAPRWRQPGPLRLGGRRG